VAKTYHDELVASETPISKGILEIYNIGILYFQTVDDEEEKVAGKKRTWNFGMLRLMHMRSQSVQNHA
jgi:hypothetical protein